MSIHPSLSSPAKNKKQKSVLKRTERLTSMLEKKQWKEGDDVFGLPKLKTIRIKIKKEKAEKVEAVKEGAAAAAAPAAGQPTAKAAAKTTEKK